MLKIEKLKKSFGNKIVLTDVSFEINYNEILALVGPNGAGKTTTINCICEVVEKDSGKILFENNTINTKIKEYIAVLPEERNMFQILTGNDYRKIWSKLYPNWNEEIFEKLISKYNLNLSERIENYSIGMKTLFLVSLVISSGSKILLLDEPTQHLDPTVRVEIMKFIRDYSDLGNIILVSSHEIFEIEEYADKIAIIKNGSILYSDYIDNAKESHRIIESEKISSNYEIIGLIGNKILVKTNEDIGRFPKLNEIVVGYLKGKETDNIFE
ncbi:MAG: type transport system ATP-binding protein [Thermosipho sp. (in: thermotogales)]|nr:type transport system ATP-binding protein [Thermosipho sp. (in: thermotogales)]